MFRNLKVICAIYVEFYVADSDAFLSLMPYFLKYPKYELFLKNKM